MPAPRKFRLQGAGARHSVWRRDWSIARCESLAKASRLRGHCQCPHSCGSLRIPQFPIFVLDKHILHLDGLCFRFGDCPQEICDLGLRNRCAPAKFKEMRIRAERLMGESDSEMQARGLNHLSLHTTYAHIKHHTAYFDCADLIELCVTN